MTPDVVAALVSHGQARYVERCLAALERERVPVALLENIPDGSAALGARRGARAGVNPVPRRLGENWNAIARATRSRYLLTLNPDTVVHPGAVARLVEHADAYPRCGVAGPLLLEADGAVQRSRRSFPRVRGTLVRRTPVRLLLGDVEAAQPQHYLADLPRRAVRCDWMLGACLLLRRSMLEEIGLFDEAFPMYGEDIELQYRAMRHGWERWYVPEAVAEHEYQRVIDRRFASRRTLWHLRGMARFVQRHPESLLRL